MEQPNAQNTPQEKAKQVLKYFRKLLSRAIPPLTPAFYNLIDVPIDIPSPIQTDGIHLYYHPQTLWDSYSRNSAKAAEQFLHVVVHCLFGHVMKAPGYLNHTQQFDFAADYQTAAFIGLLYTHRLLPFNPPPHSPPTKWYSFGQLMDFKKHPAVPASDNHDLWRFSDNTEFPFLISGDGPGENSPDKSLTQWQEIEQRVFQQLSDSTWGNLTNSLEERLDAPKESPNSYKELLQSIFRVSSTAGENPDDLDLMLYHYGCQLGTPIVEPCEELEEPNNGSLIIAIDTSGSCCGEIAGQFLKETCQMLKDVGPRWRGNLVVLQCDAKIQQVIHVKEPAHFSQKLAQNYVLRGMGGTDFRPAFQWANDFQKKGSPLSALLYLSDGYGDFPGHPPDYPVYFIVPHEPFEDSFSDLFGDISSHFPNWVHTVYFPIEE